MALKFCSLRSGSNGNCYYICSGDTQILIDAGMNGKAIEKTLKEIDVYAGDIDAILITHEHRDHIWGAGVLSRRFDIPIYANRPTWDAMSGQIGKICDKNIRIFESNTEFTIGDLNIVAYKKSHDAAEPVIYSIRYGGYKISVVTDLGYVSKGVARCVMDSDVLVLESNHDVKMLKEGRYPYFLKQRILSNYGHLSNDAAAEFLVKISRLRACGMVFLGHLSENNNTPELALNTVMNKLMENGVKLDVKVASREFVSEVVKL
ncbi:Phosphoribosyl 1,2-cyclic phosphodiesterase [Caldanaerobius fijiensis DSM 17918]|uniref:Phosphoribosyl 1,2-cyclic phosphodiesterase n=1 Tax=Caldanaerobius fijiensis DSM 17918 TaxID=1121256 RepID=A0A1M4X8V4_9THEO|nr:MBL fold metallo-hydrolase [Caldanaerobius fijiensis]SHE89914.1 Phosphoribosyl 1,2-cyclic phosphodiesterase [Caldanaerobius fijiensis DSM 17918]